MTKINLLPWREERRQELKRQFFMILAGVIIVGAGSIYVVDMNVQSQIAGQNQRNQFVEAETKKLEQQIKEIRELKKKRESLVDRMKIIQDLQGNRPEIVKMFDELVRTLPDGVHYRQVKKSGETLTIIGKAESNNRVSNLMRSLDSSELFIGPNLSKVSSAGDRGTGQRGNGDSSEGAASEFHLTVNRQIPAAEEE